MTVDWFLIDAPHQVPAEFTAWEAAKARHKGLFFRVLEMREGTEAFDTLERAAREAKVEADRLERIARDAWRRQSTR